MQPLKNFFKWAFRRWDKQPKEQNFYVKMFFAFLSGIFCASQGIAFAGIRGILFGFLVYTLALFVITYLLELDPAELGGRQKLVTDSLFSYLLLWILIWTLLFAFTAPPSIYENLQYYFTAQTL